MGVATWVLRDIALFILLGLVVTAVVAMAQEALAVFGDAYRGDPVAAARLFIAVLLAGVYFFVAGLALAVILCPKGREP